MQQDLTPGFKQPTMDQARLSGVRCEVNGQQLIADTLGYCMFEQTMPLTLAPARNGSSSDASTGGTEVMKLLKQLRRELSDVWVENQRLRSEAGNRTDRDRSRTLTVGRGGRDGTRGGGSFRPGVPRAVQDKSTRTNNGKARCSRVNLDGCDKATPGARCPKGWHLCARSNRRGSQRLKGHSSIFCFERSVVSLEHQV